MQDYLKPTKKDSDPTIFIFHVVQIIFMSTNDYSLEMIVDKIIETTELLKTEDNKVVLSAIIPSGDKLNQKVEKVIRKLVTRT